jgi:hypothetical protein
MMLHSSSTCLLATTNSSSGILYDASFILLMIKRMNEASYRIRINHHHHHHHQNVSYVLVMVMVMVMVPFVGDPVIEVFVVCWH